MKAKVIKSDYFIFNTTGPMMTQWLTIKDLLLPGASRGNEYATIVGAEYDLFYGNDHSISRSNWIIFYKMLVIQIVPEVVHSNWHLKYKLDNEEFSGLWLIEDSEWKKAFNQKDKDLENREHFIVSFSSNIIEVICEDLILGDGKFHIQSIIDNDLRFAEEYLYRANTYREMDRWEDAKKDFDRYHKLTKKND